MQPVTWQDSLERSLGVYLPSILGALAIVLIGWLVALALSAATRNLLARVGTNHRLATHTQSHVNFEHIASRIVFWAVLLLALIGAFSVLRVEGVSGPLSTLATTVMMYLPRLLLAFALAVLAWLVATVVRSIVNRALGATKLDERLSQGADMQPISNTMGNVAYWLVLLLFLPAIVGTLQIDGLMEPLTGMTSSLLGILPNLFAAAVIAVVGWIVAKAVRGLVTNLLAATGMDRFSQGHEATRGMKLSQLGGTLAFILIIVPTLIAALDALQIEAISEPLTGMLEIFLYAVPNVLAAAAILLIAWFLGRFVAELVTRLLANLGFDRVPERIGLGHAFAPTSQSDEPTIAVTDTTLSTGETAGTPGIDVPLSSTGTTTVRPTSTMTPALRSPRVSLSELGGRVALFFIMLFATVEAASLLGFEGVHDLLETFIEFGANVLLGLVIFVVGYWLADLAANAIQRANRDNSIGLARIARVAILGLVIAMGLRAMGIADEIVNLAFGLVLGAVAVAVALAFGLGGRDAAGRIAQRWADQYLDRDNGNPPQG
ncbi:mechanosensitive ion channel [Cognatilysobacter bugurensis]|uniref:Small-conductance mechanosensitive channel n=1 Tax=Cognatilysobacter bugurensis TaxID=543356 RepID=A0A918T160_9GAMM|nr:mechanosensitive ion channel [Lysobacter bugurensis]GHA81076.1 hypothetical protein GCM10007067_19000 [Lysobacter bugurensis]